jgi:hypothetical protein
MAQTVHRLLKPAAPTVTTAKLIQRWLTQAEHQPQHKAADLRSMLALCLVLASIQHQQHMLIMKMPILIMDGRSAAQATTRLRKFLKVDTSWVASVLIPTVQFSTSLMMVPT